MYRLRGIGVTDGILDRGDERRAISRSFKQDACNGKSRAELVQIVIDHAFTGVQCHTGPETVAHNAYDREPRCSSLADVLSKRVLSGPILPRKVFIDDRSTVATEDILVLKKTSAAKRDSQRPEEVRRNVPAVALRGGSAWRRGLALDFESPGILVGAKGNAQ